MAPQIGHHKPIAIKEAEAIRSCRQKLPFNLQRNFGDQVPLVLRRHSRRVPACVHQAGQRVMAVGKLYPTGVAQLRWRALPTVIHSGRKQLFQVGRLQYGIDPGLRRDQA